MKFIVFAYNQYDILKARRGGTYPPDWWAKVMKTGLHAAIMNRCDDPGNPDFQTQVEAIVHPMLGIV